MNETLSTLYGALFQSTEEDHADFRHLQAAVVAMRDVAVAINEFKRRKDLGENFLD